jgi:hypothetical protein
VNNRKTLKTFVLIASKNSASVPGEGGADWGIGEGKWKLRDLKLAGGGGGCSIWIVMACN